jgi:hypothetical protein
MLLAERPAAFDDQASQFSLSGFSASAPLPAGMSR